jgi:D-alanine-D-alanine ligase
MATPSWQFERYQTMIFSACFWNLLMPSNANLAIVHAVAPPRRRAREDDLKRQIDKMFRRLRVAVIYAGDKSTAGAVINASDNPRSWKSYESVARDIGDSLARLGVREVSVLPEDMQLGRRLRTAMSHLAWINSGGVQGYSSVAHAPAMLEMFGVPYVGHDPMSAAMLDNKHVFKRQVRASGLPTADFTIWHPSHCAAEPTLDPQFLAAFGDDARGPFIVKPVSGRASLHVNYVEDASELRAYCEKVFDITKNQILIERYLPGREFCIAVAGRVISRGRELERLDEPFAFAPIERVLESDERIFTSMDLKPITGKRARVLDPVADAEIITRLNAVGRAVYQRLSLESLVRLDVRMDANGELKILEANPKPDLKAPTDAVTSLICLGLVNEGMDYDDLIFSLLADRIDVLLAQSRGAGDRLRALI